MPPFCFKTEAPPSIGSDRVSAYHGTAPSPGAVTSLHISPPICSQASASIYVGRSNRVYERLLQRCPDPTQAVLGCLQRGTHSPTHHTAHHMQPTDVNLCVMRWCLIALAIMIPADLTHQVLTNNCAPKVTLCGN